MNSQLKLFFFPMATLKLSKCHLFKYINIYPNYKTHDSL